MSSRSRALEALQPWRRAIVAMYVAVAGLVVVQRGIIGPQHTVFKIFRQSFWHLLAGSNLYAAYPAQQGGAHDDLFKYSPTAALLYAPFALPPYGVALFAWSLLGALLLFHALSRVLAPQPALFAAILVFPDLVASLQACSSNAHIAALIILAFAALEYGHQLLAAVSIVLGAAIKIFPLGALTFAVFHGRRSRFALIVLAVAVIALLLPLTATSPARLAQQYRWWYAVEGSDARDLLFGLSAMRLLRGWVGGSWPNWPIQIAGTVLLLLPLVLRRERRPDREFRLGYLGSVLAYAVLFNHQAERPSFVIASAGVAIWCVSPPRGTGPTAIWARTLLAITALVGLKTLPLLVVWLVMQAELYGWRMRRSRGTSLMSDTAEHETQRARARISALVVARQGSR